MTVTSNQKVFMVVEIPRLDIFNRLVTAKSDSALLFSLGCKPASLYNVLLLTTVNPSD